MSNYPSNDEMQKIYDLLLNIKSSMIIGSSTVVIDKDEKDESVKYHNMINDFVIIGKIIDLSSLLFHDVSAGMPRDRACKHFIEGISRVSHELYVEYFANNNCERTD